MELTHKSRRRWSLFLLLIWLPVYIVIAITLLGYIDNLNKFLAIPIYAVLGVAWAYPFKFVFKGIGKADPDADDADS